MSKGGKQVNHKKIATREQQSELCWLTGKSLDVCMGVETGSFSPCYVVINCDALRNMAVLHAVAGVPFPVLTRIYNDGFKPNIQSSLDLCYDAFVLRWFDERQCSTSKKLREFCDCVVNHRWDCFE